MAAQARLCFASHYFELAQKLQIFLMVMARHTLANDREIEYIQSGKQSGGAVPFVVVREGATTAFLQQQTRLRSFQSLNSGSFVNAQYQGFNRGFKYKPTTSLSFSTNRLSLENFKVRSRCGCSPLASQIRCFRRTDTPQWDMVRTP